MNWGVPDSEQHVFN